MFRPYFAVDIETTGLPSKDFSPKILEISIIFDDMGYCSLEKPLELHFFIKHEVYDWQSKEVEELNNHLLSSCESEGLTLSEVKEKIAEFTHKCRVLNDGYDISIAAKNVGKLVVPCLELNELYVEGMSYRNLDVASLYYLDFGYVPTFSQIAQKYNLSHDGTCLEDSRFIVHAVQKKVYQQLGI